MGRARGAAAGLALIGTAFAGCDKPSSGVPAPAAPKFRVAIIDYPVATSVQERTKGFEEALGKHPDIGIVARPPGGGVRDQAATATENLLQAHPDLDAIFGINDNSALGALSVLQARGKANVIVVGFDADPEGREAIRKGTLLADAIQYPRRIGTVTVESVVRHLKGGAVPKEILIETGVLDKAALEAEDKGAPPPAGAGDVSPMEKPCAIGVSLLTKTHPFYKDLEAGMRDTAERLKAELKIQAAEFDAAQQTSQIENFVTQKVDAIVICPVDSQTMGGAIKRANDAKIPVFTADIRSKQGDIVCHIASDNVQGGRLIGEYLAKALHARKQ